MKISIIIPTKDRPEKLQNVIHMLDKQTYSNFEIIIINDGKVKLHVKSIHKLRIFRSYQKGVSAARNVGIKKSDGELLIFLGDDMYPHIDFVREHYKFHHVYQKSNYAMVGLVEWHEKLGNKLIYQFLSSGIQFDFASLRKNKKVDFNHFYTANLSIKKTFIELFNEKMKLPFYEDIELAIRLTKKGLITIFNPKAFVKHDHYYDDKLLSERAFMMGCVYRTLETEHIFERTKLTISLIDKFKFSVLNLLNKIVKFQLKYYHYLYIFNFIKGYESKKYNNCKSR